MVRTQRVIPTLGAVLFLFLVALPAPLFAQANTAEAQRLAGVLGNQNELPVNVRLRYQVLNNLIPGLKGKGDPKPVLTFFSTTRVLSWNRPVSQETAQNLRSFESQVVALAKEKGFNLDLPPVGYSTAGAPLVPAGPAAGEVLPKRPDRDTLAKAVLRAEEFGTDALNRANSPQLLALRDSLTALRIDLADPGVASDAVRELLRTRVEFLTSSASDLVGPDLVEHLDRATDLVRAAFPPEVLRQSRGLVIDF